VAVLGPGPPGSPPLAGRPDCRGRSRRRCALRFHRPKRPIVCSMLRCRRTDARRIVAAEPLRGRNVTIPLHPSGMGGRVVRVPPHGRLSPHSVSFAEGVKDLQKTLFPSSVTKANPVMVSDFRRRAASRIRAVRPVRRRRSARRRARTPRPTPTRNARLQAIEGRLPALYPRRRSRTPPTHEVSLVPLGW
jgi:hypothetical protein